MFLLRILTLPVSLATFSFLYTGAMKAPATVEVVGLLMWPLLAIALLVKVFQLVLRFAAGKGILFNSRP